MKIASGEDTLNHSPFFLGEMNVLKNSFNYETRYSTGKAAIIFFRKFEKKNLFKRYFRASLSNTPYTGINCAFLLKRALGNAPKCKYRALYGITEEEVILLGIQFLAGGKEKKQGWVDKIPRKGEKTYSPLWEQLKKYDEGKLTPIKLRREFLHDS